MLVSETSLNSEWDSEKNVLSSREVSTGSQKKVWWVCDKEHSFEARPGDRFRADRNPVGCPYCAGKRVLYGFNDVESLFPELVPSFVNFVDDDKAGLSLKDVTSRSQLVGVWKHEHNGQIFYWNTKVANRTSGQGCPVCAGKVVVAGFNDFGSLGKGKEKLWHPTLNVLTPSQVTVYSKKVVWWVCNLGHEWEASVASVSFTKSSGCPYCAGKKVLTGFNDFGSQYPELVKFWDVKKNRDVDVYTIAAKSNMKVWWVCDEGHSHETRVSDKVRFSSCPVCVGRFVETGFNSIEVNEAVFDEWNYVKNEGIVSSAVHKGSHRKVWWVCEKGHEWVTSPKERVGSVNRKGTGCPICVNKKIVEGVNDLATVRPDVFQEWDDRKNTISAGELGAGSGVKVWWVCGKGHSTYRKVVEQAKFGCIDCESGNSSRAEKIIGKFLEDFGFKVIYGTRKVLSNKELDIYLPEKNFAVEFNGLYWHSEEQGKGKYYHYDKWKACKDKGIQLVQVWEDDWNRNPELVKRMLAHKLGVTQESKVYARDTEIVSLNKTECDLFLKKYHIQGGSSGSVRLGLQSIASKEIVAVIVFKGSGEELELVRFATSQQVVGGFTKLLRHVELTYAPKSVVTFSDNCVSDGGLYEKHGFEAVKELKPDYMYVVKNQRKHKFGYRLKRFRNDVGLRYVEGLTEKELALINDLDRIWDAGKTKWVLRISG